ncbi:unnamed protein product [Chrysoparadoxa australica]
MAATTCPVYRPTKEEFANFREYIKKIDHEAAAVGLCKIIPPPEWRSKFAHDLSDLDTDFLIPSPIKQCPNGGTGVFQLGLVETKAMTIDKFRRMAERRDSGEKEVTKRVRKFWRGLRSTMEPPVYGADTLGSVFKEDDTSWNVSKLDTILQLLGENLPGITSSMLYFGMWQAIFAFHVEDVNLYSINYIHTGAPKSWYSISPRQEKRFESVMQGFFPEEYMLCREFLRHKTSLISPQRLQAAGISYTTCLQEAGEFMITFPASYHAGFNHGFNVAESTNFAIDRWIEEGKRARMCRCRPYVVHIDMELFERKLRWHRERLRNGEAETYMPGSQHQNRGGDGAQGPIQVHGNMAELETWTFDCICGQKRTSADAGRTAVDDLLATSTYECQKCGAWSHVSCSYQVTSRAELPAVPCCWKCVERVPESHEVQKTKATGAKRKRKRSGNDGPASRITVGASVLVALGADVKLEGVIQELDNGIAKVHYKGGFRTREDEWIPVESGRFLVNQLAQGDIAMDGSSLKCAGREQGAVGRQKEGAPRLKKSTHKGSPQAAPVDFVDFTINEPLGPAAAGATVVHVIQREPDSCIAEGETSYR